MCSNPAMFAFLVWNDAEKAFCGPQPDGHPAVIPFVPSNFRAFQGEGGVVHVNPAMVLRVVESEVSTQVSLVTTAGTLEVEGTYEQTRLIMQNVWRQQYEEQPQYALKHHYHAKGVE